MYEEPLTPVEELLEERDNSNGTVPDPVERYEILRQRNHDAVKKFLGETSSSVEAYATKWYYAGLLAWGVKSLTATRGWQTSAVFGNSLTEPVYRDIKTDYDKSESCLIDGQMLIEKEGVRLVIRIVAGQKGAELIEVESGLKHQAKVKQFIQDIADYIKENNFYKYKKLSFDCGLSFLNINRRDWESVILNSYMKTEIRRNTIGFLKNCTRLTEYGIPPKRGIILAGEPGTGKTIICKSLISEADQITCINSYPYGMMHEGYISDLFSIAQDLSPTMVFIEDIDFIGQERHESYRGTQPLIALLAEMDGIAEKTAIVTVATSNAFETLDKALSERPSRFDRIFKINRPDYQRRVELLKYLSRKIPLSADITEYIVQQTDGFTPAQIQEIMHGMVIARIDVSEEAFQFTRKDVDAVITLINMKKQNTIGFNMLNRKNIGPAPCSNCGKNKKTMDE